MNRAIIFLYVASCAYFVRFHHGELHHKSLKKSGRQRLIKLLELIDADAAVGEAGHNLQISAHCLDDTPQGGDIHIRTFLDPGNIRLPGMQISGHFFLAHFSCLAQLLKRHLL